MATPSHWAQPAAALPFQAQRPDRRQRLRIHPPTPASSDSAAFRDAHFAPRTFRAEHIRFRASVRRARQRTLPTPAWSGRSWRESWASIVERPTPERPQPLRQRLGDQTEERAAQRLLQAGFVILERNYRCRGGELDIVARRGAMLVIAEVRLRSSNAFGGAAASITAAKRRRILRAARYLLLRQPRLAQLAVRFDVLLATSAGGPLEWIEAAFSADGS
jgi:putative endonuclease